MKTTRIYQILALAAILPWVAACVVQSDSNDVAVENPPRKQFIPFRADIAAPTIRVAHTTGAAGETSWNQNDSILIIMDQAGAGSYNFAQSIYVVKTIASGAGAVGQFNFSPTGSSPTTQPFFPLNNDYLDFFAFYPYENAGLPLTGTNLTAYPIDITRQNSSGTSSNTIGVRADFMYATTGPYSLSVSGGPGPPSPGSSPPSPTSTVDLHFEHQLVKLVVKVVKDPGLMGGTWNLGTLVTATIKNAIKTATFDLTIGAAGMGTLGSGLVSPLIRTGNVMDIAMRKHEYKSGTGGADTLSFEAILLPQMFVPSGGGADADSLIVYVPPVTGASPQPAKTFKTSLENLFAGFTGGNMPIGFDPKTKYTVTANLKGNLLTNISGDITPWIDGGEGTSNVFEQ